MLALEGAEDLASAAHHGTREAGELCHVNAVGAVGTARLEPMEFAPEDVNVFGRVVTVLRRL